jgi:hypothetical protein
MLVLRSQEALFKVKRLGYFALAFVSTLFVTFVTIGEYWLFVDMPVSEQLKLPAVMPYDVEQHEPWNVVTGYTILSLLLVLAATFVAWNVVLVYRFWIGQEEDSRHEGRAGILLAGFLLISCVTLIGCFLLGIGYFGGISVGLE